jgi:intraflagellar transport protein 140
MYQASNQWEKALKLSLTQDRMNLKRTYYDYARHLENEGNEMIFFNNSNIVQQKTVFAVFFVSGKTQAAREMYEKCQTHHFDVPRMLFEDAAALEEYCTSTNDS